MSNLDVIRPDDAEILPERCSHDPNLFDAIGIGYDRAEAIKGEVIAVLNQKKCIACLMEECLHHYSWMERVFAGYVVGVLVQKKEDGSLGPLLERTNAYSPPGEGIIRGFFNRGR